MAALTYCTVGSNRIEEAKVFYDGVLALVGLSGMHDSPRGRIYGRDGGFSFGVLTPYDGNAASVGNGSMFSFACDSRDEVDALHAKAISLGGACEGAPGERQPGAYFSYFRDLDGNKLCAYCIG
ncbi:catechol 2,3-dioxygenase-like lactoylglutathione lyase family enzyme [Sphingobium sp. OAS761]|uniref:VOC family protein n=1 Tax=Sphingobium sp. OAS761 TaxID=2817901 RepID=UPI00209CA5FF|nr:VOC family protein [Sphingobium sp. OAS761]MCP1471379.1 catechol 2,3-dioxygenase-like lactoylglutathione lyase family enzyme [Sphingobium sp. OAS761]